MSPNNPLAYKKKKGKSQRAEKSPGNFHLHRFILIFFSFRVMPFGLQS